MYIVNSYIYITLIQLTVPICLLLEGLTQPKTSQEWESALNSRFGRTELWPSPKLVTIKKSHCYKVYRKGFNSYKLFDVRILLQRLFVVTILLQQINVVTIRIGCNNVTFKYLLLQ